MFRPPGARAWLRKNRVTPQCNLRVVAQANSNLKIIQPCGGKNYNLLNGKLFRRHKGF
jgi:hypothetical protein